MSARHGGQLLVDQLVIHGADLAFTVPGESFLAALDGFYTVRDKLKLVVCRHESAAANMAEAYGKLTNRPGLCFVTRGPGATQASVGVHTAFQDSTPMILFIGDVGGDFRDREAFQEVDFTAMFRPLAKWVERIDDVDRIPEYVARAYQIATSGRRGPVVLALPEDMLSRGTNATDAKPYVPSEPHPGREAMEHFTRLLASAKTPLVILGGGPWTRESCNDMQRFIEANALPCACAFRYQDLFDNRHANYVGDVGIGINPVLA
ncbi:MAG TPA: thiamine pyrophosphate-binding protein, partial [Usitatibacter sp.]